MTGDNTPDTKTPFNGDFASAAALVERTYHLCFGLGAAAPNRMHDGVVAFHQALENSGIHACLSSLRVRHTNG